MDRLSGFLLGDDGPPSAGVLRQAHLAAYAYTVLPADHPARAELRAEYLAALTRHQLIKQQLAPLLAAWRAAGVHAMLFKGFALSEFVYPVAGARFHGDVDILVRSEHETVAMHVATDLGWADEMYHARAHGVCSLCLPGGAAQVDLHRLALHSVFPWPRRRRLTEAIWARAREIRWADTAVHVPHPVDALLILVLQRAWGTEGWRLKPHDALDMRALTEHAGVTMEAVRERARELGCAHTLELFLARCNPGAGRLTFAPPSRLAVLRWNMATLPERRATSTATEWQLTRLSHAPRALAGAAFAIPLLLRVRRALRTHTDLRRLLASLTPPPSPFASHAKRERAHAVRAIRWAVRLLRLRAGGACVVRSLAMYVALRRRGWPVVFVSGVRRDEGGVVGHAWVELDGRVLPELSEPLDREHYRVNFQYPDVAGRRNTAMDDDQRTAKASPLVS